MKRTLISCALLAGMAMANTAMAQDYDDRWYLTAGAGYSVFDGDRNVDNEFYGTLGFGKFLSPNFSLDLEAWHSNPELDYDFDEERNWELMSLSLVGRYHFGAADTWRPYLALGVGVQEHHDGTQTQPLALGFNESRKGNNLLGIAGVGVQGDLWRGSLRAEIGARYDMDDEGVGGDDYVDGYAGLSFVLPLGSRDVAEPAPAAVVSTPAPTCSDLDDDRDGVNNCNDRCASSAAGEAVGADGCAMPVQQPQPEPQPEPMQPKPFRG